MIIITLFLKKVLAFCFILLISKILIGQDTIQLVRVEFKEIIDIKDINKDVITRARVYSDNNLNVGIIEVYPPDVEIEQKAQRNIIKLYDQCGRLLGASQPVELYDWYIKPMGDDSTVLLTLSGITEHSYLKFLKTCENTLDEMKKIRYETSDFAYDIDDKGEKLIMSFSAYEEMSGTLDLVLYDHNGLELWSATIDEKDIHSLKIARNYIVAASTDDLNRIRYIYVFNYNGQRLMKYQADEWIGNYEIEYSDDDVNRYFGVASEKKIYFFDSNTMNLIKIVEPEITSAEIHTFLVDKKGNLIVVIKDGIFVETINNQQKHILLDFSGYPKLSKNNNGDIILEIWTPEKSEYYEIKY
jgi:hypothetical protein